MREEKGIGVVCPSPISRGGALSWSHAHHCSTTMTVSPPCHSLPPSHHHPATLLRPTAVSPRHRWIWTTPQRRCHAAVRRAEEMEKEGNAVSMRGASLGR
ncbi:glycosyltransferase family 9 protein [Sesbania bispinosa]|nr:glycosyltransferase family 9 protein [Sesbania bispinosa]